VPAARIGFARPGAGIILRRSILRYQHDRRGEMQEILIDMAILGLFVFLFSAMSLGRKDLRLRLWVVGWFSVEAHFAFNLWQPADAWGRNVQTCGSAEGILLAGTCFVYSAAIHQSASQLVRKLGAGMAALTLVTLSFAVFSASSAVLLAMMVAGRQALGATLTLLTRRRLGAFLWVSLLVIAGNTAWMLGGVLTGHPEIVIYGLLGEVFLIAAIHFLANGWYGSAALKTMIGGFVAWSAAFPTAYWLGRLWPKLVIDHDAWNVPKVCVMIGMVLLVMEEDNHAARVLNKEYRLLFDNNPHALWITEAATLRILAANQVTLDMHGFAREEFLGKKLTDFVHPSVREEMLAHFASSGRLPHYSSRHLRKDGSMLHLDVTACEIEFEGRPARFVMAVDSTEREALEEQLSQQAGHDPLTGLPNRTLFPELLGRALKHAADEREKVAVISLDIDRFKKRVNDIYGLHIGDAYIERIAGELTARMRSMDIVARTGGNEFTLIATGMKSTASADQAVSDVQEIFARPLIVQGYKIHLPVSIGVAVGPDDGNEAIALWRGAESARDEAKSAGLGGTVWLSAELRKAADEQVKLEAYLRTHMDDGGLHLAYQPIYGQDGRVRSMEALLRLDHPEFGRVDPSKLIPIAEETGLIIPLGEWVIEEVARQLLIWKSQGMPLVPVAVNASGLQIMHVDFASHLLGTLERYAIDPRLMHIELTESVAMRNVAGVAEQIAALSAQGIAFSIDDFGTGHSSLARLSELGASILKIDRSFVMQPGSSKKACSIVQAIITMAHTLGHVVVAEGVETEQQLSSLLGLGCDLYQGYLLSRPVPPDQIPALVVTAHKAFPRLPETGESLRLVERITA
jgi:diguanylate cyclase (GGDEF)-like protein/PAS domain S-box-containing protein